MEEPQELSFEQALTRLEEIVEQLDAGQLTLEQALEYFREGARLKELCERKLAEAEAVIEQYIGPEQHTETQAEDLND